jgi:hypothetical protein
MPRDYETPEDYAGIDHDAEDAFDAYADRCGDADREEAALRRWEAAREMPFEHDEPEPDDTIAHAMWLRREEYGDQDPPDVEVAA